MILFFGGVVLTIGDIVMKRWALTSDWQFLALGMLLWIGGLGCLAATIKTQNIAVASIMLIFFNVATLAVVEWKWFGNIMSVQQIAGLMIGAVAIALLSE